MYDAIVALVPRRSLVWDCATGSGQAARDLARYFTRVVATDASAEQIRHAARVANVEYRVAPAESSGLATGSADLVTVAQALHWLDRDPFYAEVRRVLAPDGVIAVWTYGSCHAGADVEPLLRELELETLAGFWAPARRWVNEGYRTIPFPFDEIPMPSLELRVIWTLAQLGEYLRSWSAVAAYRAERGEDPVVPLIARIQHHWGAPERTRQITWPLSIRAGRGG